MPAALVRSAINGAQGRRRAATYPPRARNSDASDPDGDMMPGGRRVEGHGDANRGRLAEEGRSGHGRRHTSPSLCCERERSASLAKRYTRTDYKLSFLSPHKNSRGNDNRRSSTSLPSFGYKEVGGGIGDTGTSGSSREAGRESRRRSRRSATPGVGLSGSGFRDDVPSPAAKQQTLVKVMFGLAIVLTSMQILTLVVHPPREITGGIAARDRLHVAATSGMTLNSVVGVAGPSDNNRRMTSGAGSYGGNLLLRGAAETRHRAESLVLQDREQQRGTAVSRDFVEEQERGAARSSGGDRYGVGAQGDVFSLTNPRAFEMVTADMGNLKDTVEKLDRAFRDTMSQQGKDLAALMDQLGLQSVGDARLTAQAAAPPRPGGLVPAFFFDNAQQQVNEDIPAQVQIGTRGGGKDGAIKGLVAGGTSGASGVGVKPSEGSKNSKITSAEDSITDSRNTSPIIKESRKKDEPAGSENSTPTLSALALSRTSGIPVPSTADKPEPISSTTADLEKRKKSGDGGIRPREVKPRPGTGGTDTEGDDSGEEKPGHGGGGRAESTGLDAVWTAYSQGRWVNGRWAPKVLLDDTAPDLTLMPESNQKRVLLLSERRSGAQAIGRVLNADPQAFYIGDPCRMGGGPEALDGSMCAAVVSRLLACQPTINDVRNLFSFSYLVERSRALSEFEQLRWHAGGTPEDNDELVRQWLSRDCRLSKVVIVKETRLPELTPQLLAPGLDNDFLYVVRDPRAAVHGLAEVWERSKNDFEQANAKDCTELAAKFCSLTERKINGLMRLGTERVHILKYEMVVEKPIDMMQVIYGWLGLGVIPTEVNDAIMRIGTVPTSAANLQGGDARQPKRSAANVAAFERATRWTTDMPAFRRQQVQAACEPLLVELGYDAPSSYDLPSSVNTVSSASSPTPLINGYAVEGAAAAAAEVAGTGGRKDYRHVNVKNVTSTAGGYHRGKVAADMLKAAVEGRTHKTRSLPPALTHIDKLRKNDGAMGEGSHPSKLGGGE